MKLEEAVEKTPVKNNNEKSKAEILSYYMW